MNNPEYIGAIFDYMMKFATSYDMYVMIYGSLGPAQRDIIRRRCLIEITKYNLILNWLIDHLLSYSNMEQLEDCQ